jgi:hypothetical protein
MPPAYNSSNGNEPPFIYTYPGAPFPSLEEWEEAQGEGRAGLLRRMFKMAKLEVTIGGNSAPDAPAVKVHVDASPEEMAVATMVGTGLVAKAKEKLGAKLGKFLRFGR